MEKLLTAAEYLSHRYALPTSLPNLPLPDENFVSTWQSFGGKDVLRFLAEKFALPVDEFTWAKPAALRIEFAQTLGGRLPVIKTANHDDFCRMVALLNAHAPQKYPPTVNAFTIPCKAATIFGHRLILLNSAPYSNVGAAAMGLREDDWLQKSYLIRLRHESAHYETLRLLGGMKNHAFDEILADTLGQLAAFGHFDADRQRLFFGLKEHGAICSGRLEFYCKKIFPNELPKVYRAIDSYLETVATQSKALAGNEFELFKILACRAIPFN